VTEFETATFECEVSKPNLKPRWFKGSQEIKDLERFKQTSVGTKHILTIRECEVEDADVYKIVVEEGVESIAKLTVEGTSTGVSMMSEQFLNGTSAHYRPFGAIKGG